MILTFCHWKSLGASSYSNHNYSRMPGCGPNALPKNWI